MGTLLLVRHGQASWVGDSPDLLSPLGWEQSRTLGWSLAARRLRADLLVRGDLRRHRETAEAVAETTGWRLPTRVDPRWDEYDETEVLRDHMPAVLGDMDPGPVVFRRWMNEALDRWTDGQHDDYAETFDDFGRRTYDAMCDAAAAVEPHRSVVVVTSGGQIAWLVAALTAEWTPEQPAHELAGAWLRLSPVVVNTSVTKLAVGPGGIRVVSFNEHTHLEGAGAPVDS